MNKNKVHDVTCSQCATPIQRVIAKTRKSGMFFCDNICKGNWQRGQREANGWTKEWLYDQYITQGKSANEIAKEIGRDPKGVWKWISEYGIPTRPRGHNTDLLLKDGSGFRGHRHTEAAKEIIRQSTVADGRVPYLRGGVHWLKGQPPSTNPRWLGGLTPERQAFYSSLEWKACVVAVWKRDDAICQRCRLNHRDILKGTIGFHIHHIDSFTIRERRAVVANLILLCYGCHKWVHSKKNKKRKYLGEGH